MSQQPQNGERGASSSPDSGIEDMRDENTPTQPITRELIEDETDREIIRRISANERAVREQAAFAREHTVAFLEAKKAAEARHRALAESVQGIRNDLRAHEAQSERRHEYVRKGLADNTDAITALTSALTGFSAHVQSASGDQRRTLESLHEIDDAHALELQQMRDRAERAEEALASHATTIAKHEKRLTLRDGFVAAVVAVVTLVYHLFKG